MKKGFLEHKHVDPAELYIPLYFFTLHLYKKQKGANHYGITSNDVTSISEKGEQFSSINHCGRRVNCESHYASQTTTLKK